MILPYEYLYMILIPEFFCCFHQVMMEMCLIFMTNCTNYNIIRCEFLYFCIYFIIFLTQSSGSDPCAGQMNDPHPTTSSVVAHPPVCHRALVVGSSCYWCYWALYKSKYLDCVEQIRCLLDLRLHNEFLSGLNRRSTIQAELKRRCVSLRSTSAQLLNCTCSMLLCVLHAYIYYIYILYNMNYMYYMCISG